MHKTQGKNLLRAQVNTSWLYRVFNIVFVVFFAIVVLLSIFANPNASFPFNYLLLLVSAVVGVLLILLVARLFSLITGPHPAVERVVVILLLALLLCAQLWMGNKLLPWQDVGSDFGLLMQYARQSVLQGATPAAYLQLFPRNIGIYAFWRFFFTLLNAVGISNFAFCAMVLNALCITGSVALLYFCVRRLFGVGNALFVLVGCFFLLPFVVAAALPCAETLILPVPIAAVMLWQHARLQWRQGNVKKTFIRFAIASALLGLGALFKLAVFAVWVAIAIDVLVLLCGKGRLRLLLAGLAAAAIVLVGLGFAAVSTSQAGAATADGKMTCYAPVMAGLEGHGSYNSADYEKLAGFTDPTMRSAYTRAEISNRLGDMGPGGLVLHLMDKLAYTFGDGSFSFSGELNNAPPSLFRDIFASAGSYYYITAYAAFALMAGILVWMVVGAAKALMRANDALTFVRVGVFGFALFQLVWETGPRSIVCFLPLMLLCALEALPLPRQLRVQVEAKIDVQDEDSTVTEATVTAPPAIAQTTAAQTAVAARASAAAQASAKRRSVAPQEPVGPDYMAPEFVLRPAAPPPQPQLRPAAPAGASVPAAGQGAYQVQTAPPVQTLPAQEQVQQPAGPQANNWQGGARGPKIPTAAPNELWALMGETEAKDAPQAAHPSIDAE